MGEAHPYFGFEFLPRLHYHVVMIAFGQVFHKMMEHALSRSPSHLVVGVIPAIIDERDRQDASFRINDAGLYCQQFFLLPNQTGIHQHWVW